MSKLKPYISYEKITVDAMTTVDFKPKHKLVIPFWIGYNNAGVFGTNSNVTFIDEKSQIGQILFNSGVNMLDLQYTPISHSNIFQLRNSSPAQLEIVVIYLVIEQ